MPVSEAQKKASVKYLEKLDEVRIRMPKGRKDIIKAHAEALGESVNGFINRAIDNQISQDRGKGSPGTGQGPSEGGGISLHPEALQTAQEAAQMAGETVSQSVELGEEAKQGINPPTGGKLEKEA